ncbi:hypothetical protein, partial [Tsukamurella conjunctivitidis]|uniref:hypothetical protein n=1 Tax=Tsukamurella conjunctivitidis TaxID=2592068 RepID=UPI0013155D60
VFCYSDLGSGSFDNEKTLDFLDAKLVDIMLRGDAYDDEQLTGVLMKDIPKDAPMAMIILMNTSRRLAQFLLVLIEGYNDMGLDIRKELVEYCTEHKDRGA